MARKDPDDRQKMENISTDDIRGVGELSDDDRPDLGVFGGTDAPSSDSAEYVLVQKYRDDGVPYQEQIHAAEYMELDEKPEIHAEESGGRSNVSFEHSEHEDESFSSRFRSLRSGDGDEDSKKGSGSSKKSE